MKKYVFALLVAVLVMSLASFADDNITVTLNENKIDCLKYGQEPIIENGRTLVPLRAIFEALGAEVEWNNDEKSVLSAKDKTTIYLKIGDDRLIKNGREIELDVPAKIEHGRTLVPVRAVAEVFDVDVHWDKYTRTVELFDIKTAVFSKGKITDGTYENRYLGIDFTLPSGFEFLSQVQIESALAYVKEGDDAIDIKAELEKYEFAAFDKKGNNVQITTTENGGDAMLEIDKLKELYPTAVFTQSYAFYVGGQKYVFADAEHDGATQSFGVCTRGNRMINVVFTYTTREAFQNMLSGFEK